MSRRRRSAPPVDTHPPLTAGQQDALALLREAADAAGGIGRDVWQFAVEIGQLHAAGLSNTDLRRLLCLGYVEHARERTADGARWRVFRKLNTLVFPGRTCFVLSRKGREVVLARAAGEGTAVVPTAGRPWDGNCSLPAVPRWDVRARQLWWRGLLVKQLCRPAPNQEAVLEALEEDGWPARIDDPLPRIFGIDPRERLHDTIKNLNRHLIHSIICFRGDGSGRGVRWTFAQNGEAGATGNTPELLRSGE